MSRFSDKKLDCPRNVNVPLVMDKSDFDGAVAPVPREAGKFPQAGGYGFHVIYTALFAVIRT